MRGKILNGGGGCKLVNTQIFFVKSPDMKTMYNDRDMDVFVCVRVYGYKWMNDIVKICIGLSWGQQFE